MRLVEAFEDFEAYLRSAKKSKNTLKAYRADLRMVADALVGPTGRSVDELQLEDLTVSNLRRAFATRAEHTAASSLALERSHARRPPAVGDAEGAPGQLPELVRRLIHGTASDSAEALDFPAESR